MGPLCLISFVFFDLHFRRGNFVSLSLQESTLQIGILNCNIHETYIFHYLVKFPLSFSNALIQKSQKLQCSLQKFPFRKPDWESAFPGASQDEIRPPLILLYGYIWVTLTATPAPTMSDYF